MNEDKIKLLMGLFGAKDIDELKARCPINLNNGLYNFMDNEEFIEMIIMIDTLDDERIFRELKERKIERESFISDEEMKLYIESLKGDE